MWPLQTWETYIVVNFLFQLIFIFPLFLGVVMYANEFKTEEKQKLTEIKKLIATYTTVHLVFGWSPPHHPHRNF